jgi:hypothetical protein
MWKSIEPYPATRAREGWGNNCLAIAAAPTARMLTLAYRRSGSNLSTIRNNTAPTKQIVPLHPIRTARPADTLSVPKYRSCDLSHSRVDDALALSARQAKGASSMDEAHTLRFLGWTVGGVVGAVFLLNAIAFSLI